MDLDLTVPLGTIEGYVHLKGKLGRIQRLWERYCGLRLRIDRLEQQLLREEPSIFDTSYSLVGCCSFPFRPKLEVARRSGPDVASRNAVILQASSLSALKICRRLDSRDIPILDGWKDRFPALKTWVDAYRCKRCRPLVEKLISEVKAQARLL